MTLGLWLLVGVAVGFAYVFLFALCKMAARSDRDARHLEKRMLPWSDVEVTITQYGS